MVLAARYGGEAQSPSDNLPSGNFTFALLSLSAVSVSNIAMYARLPPSLS